MKNNKKRKKKKSFSGFDKFVCNVYIIAIIGLIIGIICSEISLAQVNLEVQKMEDEVDTENKNLKSLEGVIDELTSLDNIKELSAQYGLELHSENIKTIDK